MEMDALQQRSSSSSSSDEVKSIYSNEYFESSIGNEITNNNINNTSSVTIVAFWTVVLVLFGWFWYRSYLPATDTSNRRFPSSSSKNQLSAEERRAQIQAARIRTLDRPVTNEESTATTLTTTTTTKTTTTITTTQPTESVVAKQAKNKSDIVEEPPVKDSKISLEQPNTGKLEQEEEESTTERLDLVTHPEQIHVQTNSNNHDRAESVENVPTASGDSKPHNTPDTTSSSKKRYKKHPPPVQVICESLSWILQPASLTITVKHNPEAATWGGVGWWKSAQISSSLPEGASNPKTIYIPLDQRYQDIVATTTATAAEDSWECVCENVQQLLHQRSLTILDDSTTPKVFMAVYFRAESLRMGRKHLFLTAGRNWMEHFTPLLKWIQQISVESLVMQLQSDYQQLQLQQHHPQQQPPPATNMYETNDLFSDDYDHSVPIKPQASAALPKKQELCPWEAFLNIINKNNNSNNDEVGVVNLDRFLEEIFSIDPKLRLGIVQDIFDKIQANDYTDMVAISNWLPFLSRHSKLLSPSWAMQIDKELMILSDNTQTGRQIESDKVLLLTPLLHLTANTMESSNKQSIPITTIWQTTLQNIDNFPFCVFSNSQPMELRYTFDRFRQQSHQVREIVTVWLKTALKSNRESVFQWVRLLLTKSLPLTSLAKSELLEQDPSSKVQRCPTHALLLGLTSSWIQFCGQSLTERFQREGVSAFDITYLLDASNECLVDSATDTSLFTRHSKATTTTNLSKSPNNSTYSGSTNLFFLACHLQRVALQSAAKMEHEFYHVHSHEIEYIRQYEQQLQQQGGDKSSQPMPQISAPRLKETQSHVATWLGYKAFLEDPAFVTESTNFALLQLQYVLAVCRKSAQTSDDHHSSSPYVPEWMIKDPSRWLAEVAHRKQDLLKPFQAEQAVEVCTELLDIGNEIFSPVVVTCLIRIALAFVRAGVQRAKQRDTATRRSRKNNDQREEWDLDIYLSFDKNDLGVAVFTNSLVNQKLCPTLIRTYPSLDVAHVDMDREYDFDKFRVKLEVAELLLRLWRHPSGKCRESIVSGVKDPSQWIAFATSCTSALSVYLDDALQKWITTLRTLQRNGRLSSMEKDQRFVEFHSSSAASGLSAARRLLLLLATLCEEPVIAAALGQSTTIGNTIVHFLDILTDEDGGTNKDFEYFSNDATISLYQRISTMTMDDIARAKHQVLRSRYFSRRSIGLDVSILCHQFLGIAAKCHFCAREATGPESSPPSSPLLLALVNHADSDVNRYQRIVERLIMQTIADGSESITATTTDSALFFFSDGYLLTSDNSHNSGDDDDDDKIGAASTPESIKRRQLAQQDQVAHADLDRLVSHELIQDLMQDLRSLKPTSDENRTTISVANLQDLQSQILSNNNNDDLSDEDYGHQLEEWTVSSAPFAVSPKDSNKFLHYYDSIAQKSRTGSGKALVQEAKKSRKAIPFPHANSSCFVCFAEERMDLCRAVVTGPIDTPYAFGIFVFDVFFPPDYPTVPPLMTFLTTGGGQVRFSPNLYVDGKVCLSLLGLTFAQDDSQRWNSKQSSLAQILLSLQTQVLGVSEPYFQEGSGIPIEQRHTPAGQEGSRRHNCMIRLATLRHAILEPLRNPPVGMEHVIRQHFSLCRRRLLTLARRWVLEATTEYGSSDNSHVRRMENTYRELVVELSNLDGPSLMPLSDDLKYVQTRDMTFLPTAVHGDGTVMEEVEEGEDDQKPSAKAMENDKDSPDWNQMPVEDIVAAAARIHIMKTIMENNPWANPTSYHDDKPATHQTPSSADTDSDDELYL